MMNSSSTTVGHDKAKRTNHYLELPMKEMLNFLGQQDIPHKKLQELHHCLQEVQASLLENIVTPQVNDNDHYEDEEEDVREEDEDEENIGKEEDNGNKASTQFFSQT